MTSHTTKQTPKEILFFPRKVVKMINMSDSKLFLIRDRTQERATRLEAPTKDTLEGLTSGLRSAIIVDERGRYFRLKGVASKIAGNKRNQKTFWGTCSMYEAYYEQDNVLRLLQTSAKDIIAISPRYSWTFPRDGKEIKILRLELKMPLECAKNRKDMNLLLRDLDLLICNTAIPAYEITGDTRIDEALYELTKRKLFGKKRIERNELAGYLSFQAGKSLAEFNAAGFAWYGHGDATDSHLGNFVIDSLNGNVKIKLTDLLTANKISTWLVPNRPRKDQILPQDLAKDLFEYKDDFQAEYTTSPASCLRYKYFSDELRHECFSHFFCGYASIDVPGINLSEIKPQIKKIKVQDLAEKEMRERINYVMTE